MAMAGLLSAYKKYQKSKRNLPFYHFSFLYPDLLLLNTDFGAEWNFGGNNSARPRRSQKTSGWNRGGEGEGGGGYSYENT